MVHLTAPLTNAAINNWVRSAIDLAAQAAARDDGVDITDLAEAFRAEYDAIPDALKHHAIESLRQHAAFANDAGERAAALRALEWVVTA
jgi:hypothetical protein